MSSATAWRKTARKMLFRHLLVMKVKDAHLIFLQTENSKFLFKNLFIYFLIFLEKLEPDDILHSEFELNSICELPLGKIPDIPKSSTPLRTAIDYFKAMPKESVEKKEKEEKIKIIDGNLLKSPTKATNIKPISQSLVSQTPKMSLLERVIFYLNLLIKLFNY